MSRNKLYSLSRRGFLRHAVGAAALGGLASLGGRTRVAAQEQTSEMSLWLQEVGSQFAGQTIRIATESTAPSRIISELAAEEFTRLTGIDISWSLLPLDQVLSKITDDTRRQSASNDIYYLDQSWLGRFVNDTLDPQTYLSNPGNELNMPGFDFEDFLTPLVDYTASYEGRLVGMPYDIPIFLMVYRRDVFDELNLQPPTTMAEYLETARIINEAELTNEDGSRIYGTVGQWQAGHYALQCDWTAWLWSHGGSHFGADGQITINDERAVEAANYMLQLGQYMPSEATTYDWGGQAVALANGAGAMAITWSEVFPLFDAPDVSKIIGLMETAPLPAEIALRTAAETSFDENPGIAHQGGSCIAISEYSRVQDAAWVFMQWATSSDVSTRASLAGGGSSPTRQSNYDDPRTLESAVVGAGTTRHFPAILEAINNRMGTEPHYPGWADASATGGPIPTELGKMVTGEQDVQTTLDNMAAAIQASL
jgi:multiple sugar transport system substrate-binding protein